MRIISGKWKGKPLKVPPGLPIRPTTDKAKEALFNILENRFQFASISCLDLFAGSGNISYELISRGCPSVLAVDKNALCCRFMEGVQKDWGMEGLKIIQSDVIQFLKKIKKQFNLIFADPPYDLPGKGNLIEEIFQLNLLQEGGMVILEHPTLMVQSQNKEFLETRVYGSSSFSFFS